MQYCLQSWCCTNVASHRPHFSEQIRLCVTKAVERAKIKQLAACKTLARETRTPMQSFEYRSVRYWSKGINWTLPGGRKK